MVKSKSKFKWKRIVVVLAVLLIAFSVGKAIAATGNSSRIETPQTTKTTNEPTKKEEAVKPPENAPEQKPAEPTPEPQPTVPVVDPNGCEAKGMWYRADNNECIPKTVASAPVIQTAVAAAPAAQAGSGDCSLVNNYSWPVATAMRVCMQESGGNPNNANWADDHRAWAGCMGSFGLMQINCSHGQLFNGAENMRVAFAMWQGSGGSFWGNWPNTCKKVGC